MALLFKYADLQPPLGLAGGPCRVVDRILKEKLPPGEADELVSLVDSDRDLSNQQAHEVYDPLVERGPHPFNQFVLTPHSQYRMDLRSVTVRDLREALSHFVSEIEDWKRKRDPRYQQLLQSDRQKMEWVDPKTGLFFVFGFGSHKGTPSLITTYWKNRKTPEAPAGGCQIRSAASYQAPAADLAGVRTFVDEKPAKGIDDPLGDSIYHAPGETWKSDRERANPEMTDNNYDLTREPKPPPVYNVPGPAVDPKDPPSKTPESKFKMRTPSTPGEEYGHPYKDNIYPRRTAAWEEEALLVIREAAGAGMFPTYDERQHAQKSYAKRYYRKNYRRHKSKIRTQARRRYKRIRNSPSFKRRKSLRNKPKYHNRFRRLPAGGARSVAERSRNEREEKKASTSLPLSFYHETWGWGDLLGFEEEGLLVHLDSDSEECKTVDLRAFTSGMIFESDEDLDTFLVLLDEVYGAPDATKVADTFYREVYKPGDNMDPGPGAQDLGEPSPVNPSLPYPDQEHRDRAQSHDIEVYRERGDQMYGAPGSAKVIPSGYGFANKEASASRVASAWRVAKRLAELLGETSTDVLLRSKVLRPKGKRFDQKNAMYTFSVPGATSKETYVVRMKVSRPAKNVTKLGRMDLEVSCSCPFWQWQGPEHWAKVGNYLYGSPRGTASKPSIKDPTSIHKVCKHVAATLDMVKGWELPTDR